MISNLTSNSLIDNDEYTKLYARLKQERGRHLAKTWQERTAPEKHVYEDIGIASYILTLLNAHDISGKYFVDLACGNGLLTYLLNGEGFAGCGIDARSRRIWERFADIADLRHASIDPSDVACTFLPQQTDFLIGNHSDELTPWIPIMAARRSCSFFLLPCCPYDFYTKFNNRPTNTLHGGCGQPRYDQYLEYIEKNIIIRLGYRVRRDRLKIPSTRKVACSYVALKAKDECLQICFVCTVPPTGLCRNREGVIEQILREASHHQSQFRPISTVAQVRNCTQIPYAERQRLSKKLANILLNQNDERIDDWRCGGSLLISELVATLTDDEKALLKAQFGGLQTFLRNHHQPFSVVRGEVKLRRWPEVSGDFGRKSGVKKSQCWFAQNHPQGCPVSEEACPYRHITD